MPIALPDVSLWNSFWTSRPVISSRFGCLRWDDTQIWLGDLHFATSPDVLVVFLFDCHQNIVQAWRDPIHVH
jgi:hypothetical protein